MRPVSELPRATCQALRGVLFDLDDTLLDHGQLSLPAYRALWELADAGLILVAVTGRPVSWGDLIAQQWPIHGAVSENGHLASARRLENQTGDQTGDAGSRPARHPATHPLGRVVRFDWTPNEIRSNRTARLTELTQELMARFPELTPASDVGGRVSDFTFDIGEHRRAPPTLVAEASAAARARGARTTVSSVHLHISFDTDDKASGSVAFLHQLLGIDSTEALGRFAYIGDSENDAPCFAAYRVTVGVANLSGAPSVPPRYRTTAPRGQGFAELAEVLLRARS
ncbi:MAG: HAD hydrolase family protein [Polyangiaceae bacterium]|nr:HAD hydrolase family protein [Polyangiaceae bacterium]MCW5792486.1 HAD hydrolase family protein [Polyangiaceae bacterium]